MTTIINNNVKATPRKVVAIFCSASNKAGAEENEFVKQQTAELSASLVSNGHIVAFGGSNVGLMKSVGEGAASVDKSKLIGISPKTLEQVVGEDSSPFVTHCVKNMSQRKKQLSKLADVYVSLIGGIGTLDELFEVIVLKQLGIENKPIFILDVTKEKKFSRLIHTIFTTLVSLGTVKANDLDTIQIVHSNEELINAIENEDFKSYTSDIPEKHRG